MRVLAIDDNPSIRKILTRQLEREGFKVETAVSAETGLDVLSNRDFDVVLLDINLPGMTGLEAIAGIVARTTAPVVVMTGFAHPETEKDARLLGASGFIEKPAGFPTLAAMLRSLRI